MDAIRIAVSALATLESSSQGIDEWALMQNRIRLMSQVHMMHCSSPQYPQPSSLPEPADPDLGHAANWL